MNKYILHYSFTTNCDIIVNAESETDAINLGNELIEESLPKHSVLPEDDILNQIIAGLTRNTIVTVDKK